MEENNLASKIDHTLLKPEVTEQDIQQLCKEAHEKGAATVCIPPYYVELANDELKESEVKVCTVIGFPFGYSSVKTKGVQIETAIDNGADELDVVVNIAAIKNGNWDYVKNEVESLSTLISKDGKIMKLIFETALLDQKEIKKLCKICIESQVEYAKTSTGYGPSGADVETVKTMRKYLSGKVLIKASGGIKSKKQAIELIEAGADRLGAISLLLEL